MKIIDVIWTPVINKIKVLCDCGNTFIFRIDRWQTICYNCGRKEYIDKLRNEFIGLYKEKKDSISYYFKE